MSKVTAKQLSAFIDQILKHEDGLAILLGTVPPPIAADLCELKKDMSRISVSGSTGNKNTLCGSRIVKHRKRIQDHKGDRRMEEDQPGYAGI